MLFVCVANECDGSSWKLFAALHVKLVYIDDEYMYLYMYTHLYEPRSK